MISIQCPNCGKKLSVDDSRAGSMGRCPGCKEKIRLEAPADDPGYEEVDDPEEAEAPRPAKKRPAAVDPNPRQRPKKKKKKKGDAPSAGVLAAVGIGVGLLVLIGISVGLWMFFKQSPASAISPDEAIAKVKQRGGSVEQDPDKTVTGLTYAGLSDGFKNSDLEVLAAFPKLKKLNLRGTKTTDLSMDFIKDATSLEVLDLSNTNVTAAGIKEIKTLKNLQELHLNNTLVTDNGLNELKGLTKLRRLTLDSTPATGMGLQAALPNLKIEK